MSVIEDVNIVIEFICCQQPEGFRAFYLACSAVRTSTGNFLEGENT
jgi:hypothetical protein